MSLISKIGSGGAGQMRIWSHGNLFCELLFFGVGESLNCRDHELNLEKTMQNAPVKSEFGATATCFVNFFDFCEIYFFFKTPI